MMKFPTSNDFSLYLISLVTCSPLFHETHEPDIDDDKTREYF
jgi:hypothetical protein